MVLRPRGPFLPWGEGFLQRQKFGAAQKVLAFRARCPLRVRFPPGAGVSAQTQSFIVGLDQPCAHSAQRESALIRLDLHVSSPVHVGEYADAEGDCDLVMRVSRAFTGSPALPGQRLGSLGQHPVPCWSGLCSPLGCPWWVLRTYCFRSAANLPHLPFLLGLALTHTAGSAYSPQPPSSLLGTGVGGRVVLSVSRTPVLPQQDTSWPGSESPAFFPGVGPAESELCGGRECACLVTIVSPGPGVCWGLRRRLKGGVKVLSRCRKEMSRSFTFKQRKSPFWFTWIH